MYCPKQIPYLLDEEFKKYIDYREYRINELSDICVCIWQMKSKMHSDKRLCNYILPDGCIDLVFNFVDKTVCFAGFSKETEPFLLNQEIDYLGIRFRPGIFSSFFHVDAKRIMDQCIAYERIEKEMNLKKIFSLSDFSEQTGFIKGYLLEKKKQADTCELADFADALWEDPTDLRVKHLANKLGIDKRQLYRLFMKHYGVSPKVFLNILRLHLCLKTLLTDQLSLKETAVKCGFYDQSHFIKEIKRYTGFSPVKLLEAYLK